MKIKLMGYIHFYFSIYKPVKPNANEQRTSLYYS